MRYRAPGSFAIALAALAFVASTASGWTELAPITPDSSDNMVYPKGLALDTGGASPGIWVTEVGRSYPADRAFKYPLIAENAPAGPTTPSQYFGGSVVANKTLNYPGGIAVNPANHDFYVANTLENKIYRYDASGIYIASTTGNDGGLIKLSEPHGLKIAGDWLYIANTSVDHSGTTSVDRGIKRVRLDDFSSWGTDVKSTSFVTGPSDVAIDPEHNRMWAADEGFRAEEAGKDAGVTSGMTGHVVKFDLSGNQLDSAGGPVGGPFAQPYSLEYDAAADVLYVGDYHKNLIYVLDADTDEVLDTMQTSNPLAPNTPTGLQLDPGSRILYIAQVGTKSPDYSSGAGIGSIRRFKLGAAPSCSGPQNTATFYNTQAAIALICDAGADTLRYEITAQPTNGAFADPSSTSGQLVYLPKPNFQGVDHFSFRVVSKHGISAPKTVEVSVAGPPPPPTAPARLTAKASLDKVHARVVGKLVKVTGEVEYVAANGAPLPASACASTGHLTLTATQTKRAGSAKVKLEKPLRSTDVNFAPKGGACLKWWTMSTHAHKSKRFTITLTDPGNDTILPIDARFTVAPHHK